MYMYIHIPGVAVASAARTCTHVLCVKDTLILL